MFLHTSPSNTLFRNGVHSLLRLADAERALTLFTVCDTYRYFVGQAVIDVKK